MADSPPSEYMSIGNLPEHIILHILSFLPTKTAIATSVLSKSWENRWSLVPALDFTSCESYARRDFVVKAFERNKALFLRRLIVPYVFGITKSDLIPWVSYAMQRNVQELDLNLDDKFVFPCSINTLVVLKLSTTHSSNGNLLLGDEIRFPSLKILHLNTITLESRDSSLLGFSSSRFPLLEEMVVRGGEFNHQVHISLPTLTYLKISYTDFKCALKIQSLNSLRYLVFDGSIGRDFHVETLPNIVEVKFDIRANLVRKCRDGSGSVRRDDDVYEFEFHGDSLISLVNAISHVKILKLSHETMEELHKATLNSSFHADSIQVFHNLVETKLQLDDPLFDVAMIMLHKFENLQHLTFVHVRMNSRDPCFRRDHAWVPPTQVPNCLTKRLMTFSFQRFRGSEDEMEITKYILKNSLVLVNAKIAFVQRIRWKNGCRIRKKLSTSISSVGCQLEFDQWERDPDSQFDNWDSDDYSS